jgi:hypothetical protein
MPIFPDWPFCFYPILGHVYAHLGHLEWDMQQAVLGHLGEKQRVDIADQGSGMKVEVVGGQ